VPNRYQASSTVEHGCCWRASVTDTESGKNGINYGGETAMVCECGSMEMAKLIAAALNVLDVSGIMEPGPV
jgi:hypothetical protein